MRRVTTAALVAALIVSGLALFGASNAQAIELQLPGERRLDIHGFYETRLLFTGEDFPANGGTFSQFRHVLSVETELEIFPDGFGPFDVMFAFTRWLVSYDCIYERGCGLFSAADSYGGDRRKLKRLVSRCSKSNELLTTAERATFGFDHSDVGRELMLLWDLPDALQEATGSHHVPSRALRFPRIANITHIAEVLVESRLIGGNGEQFVSPISEDAWLELGLSLDYLPLIYHDLDVQWTDLQAALLGSRANPVES